MEDSLEDYIKIARNTNEGLKKENEIKEVRKEALVTLQKRKECEARAVKIVEFLIEGKLRPEVFLRCLKHINQSYYQDVVEERAIGKLCGYSLCGKQIPEMPKKQYFINTKNNKVYDVTDRKNYCSNICYKASIHIKQQIDNSPLWLRKLEDCPKFELLSSTERGLPGEEIDQDTVKPIKDPGFTSVSSFTEISLTEMHQMEVKKASKKVTKKCDKKPEVLQTLYESDEITAAVNQTDLRDKSGGSANETNIHNKNHSSSSDVNFKLNPSTSSDANVKNIKENDIRKEVVEKNKIKSNISNTSRSKKKEEIVNNVLQSIKTSVHEWITLETYIFLYGETKVKEQLDEKQLQEYFKSLKVAESTVAQQRKYLEICRKLHLNELAENKFDRTVVGTKLKPIPDYKKLKEESKLMNLKVRSFYSGVPYEPNEELKETCEEEKDRSKENNIPAEDSPAVLPLVDAYSQNAIRRRIYLNSINKAMINLTQNLGIYSHYLVEDLHSLVKTFKLQAHNVVLAPAVRTLIAVILIKMLSMRDNNLKAQLETKQSEMFIEEMLNHFPNAQLFLHDLCETIEDFNLFLKQYCTKSESG